MHRLLLLGLLLVSPQLFAAEEILGQGMVNPGYEEKPAWFKNSFLDMREDVAEAAEQGKRVMLYFYQDGCPYCAKLLRENFADQQIVDTTRDNFEVIAINMWGDREVTGLTGEETTEKAFARSLRVQFTPTLLFLNEQGRVVLRANGYYPPHKFLAALNYVAQKKEHALRFRDYFARLDSRPASGKLHAVSGQLSPPYDLRPSTRASGKPLLVMFEQRVCRDCDELHGDVLRRPGVQKSLAGFDVVVLDAWSDDKLTTPDGRSLPAKQWARELNILYTPSLVFFDTQSGKEVFRTEAWLRAFHLHAAIDYVGSGAWKTEPEFQRYIERRAERMRERGMDVDLMN